MINAAIVGLGRWARRLVDSVQGKSEAIRFAAAQTRTPANAADYCRQKNIRLLDDFQSVLASPDIDAVVLATPHSQHVEQICAAAAAGKHVFVEKPVALDVASARRAAEACRKAGVVLAAGFVRRFHPSTRELFARARDGRLGTLCSLIGEQSHSAGKWEDIASWRSDPLETPAGALAGIGIHNLDLMIGLGGPIREVHCLVARRGPQDILDTTTVLLSFESGAAGSLFCSLVTAAAFRLAVYGTEGVAEVLDPSLQTFRFLRAHKSPAEHRQPVTAEVIESPGYDMIAAELAAFAHSVDTGAPFPVPVGEVIHGVAAFEAIVASARSGQAVRLS
ncbi:MAG TPA: Gfo/Idh/MocA family oxidoreductase [Xanthobacteraceae bacterium]|nr:Gfo/Idh/MocA family oxidoreductase [Xanthobacteraceae bacterium]